MNITSKTKLLAGVLATAVALLPSVVLAKKVKCYGISPAGKNDCRNAAGTHSCQGHSKIDFSGGDWELAKSKEACLADDGSVTPFEGVNPNK